MSTARIPLAGVIGHPIAHSRSPRLHGHWLQRYGIAGHYVPLDIAPDDFDAAVRMMPKLGFVGANVTLPHKERALALADHVTDRARMIGAANTLVFGDEGSIIADNTDGYGFLCNLQQQVPDWQASDGPAVVLGAGGAARAVIASLIEAGVPEIRLTNRTMARADQLRAEFGAVITVVDWAQAGAAIAGACTVANTTSLGMTGKPAMQVPLDALEPGMVVNDLVYAPLETDLLCAARLAGATPVDGLGMLLHQAVPGFEIWFGKTPVVDDALRDAVLA